MSNYREGLYLIPRHMCEGVTAYIETGRQVGDFLTAVFENDLVRAFGKADATNTAHMRQWAEFMYNYVLLECRGSPAKVKAWQERGGLGGKV
jgi:hypothetical protein